MPRILQWTKIAEALCRATRHPRPSLSWRIALADKRMPHTSAPLGTSRSWERPTDARKPHDQRSPPTQRSPPSGRKGVGREARTAATNNAPMTTGRTVACRLLTAVIITFKRIASLSAFWFALMSFCFSSTATPASLLFLLLLLLLILLLLNLLLLPPPLPYFLCLAHLLLVFLSLLLLLLLLFLLFL